jgi:hypothetical protein
VYTLGNLLEESCRDLVVGWVLGKIDWDKKLLSLRVDITNINTSLVSKKDPVTIKEEKEG